MARESRADEFRDPAKVRAWLLAQRGHVASYLAGQGVRPDAPPVPEWDLAPYVALWSFPGGWAISGDLPTDYALGESLDGPRAALRFFAQRFAQVADCMLGGRRHPSIVIGDRSDPEQQRQLGGLLASRARILAGFAEDDGLWPERLADWQDRLD